MQGWALRAEVPRGRRRRGCGVLAPALVFSPGSVARDQAASVLHPCHQTFCPNDDWLNFFLPCLLLSCATSLSELELCACSVQNAQRNLRCLPWSQQLRWRQVCGWLHGCRAAGRRNTVGPGCLYLWMEFAFGYIKQDRGGAFFRTACCFQTSFFHGS